MGKKLFNKTTGGTIMSTINNTSTSRGIPGTGIICRWLIMVLSTIWMAYLICTVSQVTKQYSKHERNADAYASAMLVLIYDYLLLIYLYIYFAKSAAKKENKSRIYC